MGGLILQSSLVKNLSSRVGQQVVKNIIAGKQRSAILNKVKTPGIEAIEKAAKLKRFRESGKKGLGEWVKFEKRIPKTSFGDIRARIAAIKKRRGGSWGTL